MKNIIKTALMVLILLISFACSSDKDLPDYQASISIINKIQISGQLPSTLEGKKELGLALLSMINRSNELHRAKGGNYNCTNSVKAEIDRYVIEIDKSQDENEVFHILENITDFVIISQEHFIEH